jgi:hypothetical protein
VNIYELQRLMGHRHITTTERCLHYAPDPNLAARLTGLWDDHSAPKRSSRSARLASRLRSVWGAVTGKRSVPVALAGERGEWVAAGVGDE